MKFADKTRNSKSWPTTTVSRVVSDRRALLLQLDTQWKRCTAEKLKFSCIMVDIDRFKSINDSYGHAMGDRVLKMIAGVLHSNVGPEYCVGRYGGEEFAVLLPATSLQQAAEVDRKLAHGLKR